MFTAVFSCFFVFSFFFNDTATTEIYTLSLHDALPIPWPSGAPADGPSRSSRARRDTPRPRSEEHTSELQSRQYLVCRILLEKKTNIYQDPPKQKTKINISKARHKIITPK